MAYAVSSTRPELLLGTQGLNLLRSNESEYTVMSSITEDELVPDYRLYQQLQFNDKIKLWLMACEEIDPVLMSFLLISVHGCIRGVML